jgi:hypothetical protein
MAENPGDRNMRRNTYAAKVIITPQKTENEQALIRSQIESALAPRGVKYGKVPPHSNPFSTSPQSFRKHDQMDV